jgi:hypothetical protein
MDQLNMMVGTWDATSEMTMAGMDQKMTSKGTATASLECDGHYLVEKYEGEMGEGQKYRGMGIRAWDPKARVFRMWWFDNLGAIGAGTSTYDAATRTWHNKAKSENPQGGTTYGTGMDKVIDDRTVEWQWTETDVWGRQTMQMKGTSRKRM